MKTVRFNLNNVYCQIGIDTPRTTMKKKLRLVIAFDTNAIYSGSESYLLKKNAGKFIQENSSHSDLEITWHLPKMVIDERKFQMNSKGLDLLPSIEKLETIIVTI